MLLKYADRAETSTFPVFQTMTIKEIKKHFSHYNIRFFVSQNMEVKVFTSNKYDHLNLESIWANIENGYIILTHKNKKDMGKNIIQQKKR